jgi:hypothetical protein
VFQNSKIKASFIGFIVALISIILKHLWYSTLI